MLIQIHAIQNHSPANLNRDDLGSPKTCYFGGVIRSRISSQCIKRSIRTSDEFRDLCGGVRTRQLLRILSEKASACPAEQKRIERILGLCGFKPKNSRSKKDNDDQQDDDKSKMLIYTTRDAINEMVELLKSGPDTPDAELAQQFGQLIAERTAAPDMALSGRMLEPDRDARTIWKNLETKVEASLQVAHAISTHEARPLVDYYVATDDLPGDDAGAGYVDEAVYASACFYKYFSINWETLLQNLQGFNGSREHLAAHTVGAFIRAAVLVNPTGKQNSFAAHNPPDGIMIEIGKTPISYANAFAEPVSGDVRNLVSQSMAQLGQYVHDLDRGYGPPAKRLWFSPNLRYRLNAIESGEGAQQQIDLTDSNFRSLDELIENTIAAIGYDWQTVRRVNVNPEYDS